MSGGSLTTSITGKATDLKTIAYCSEVCDTHRRHLIILKRQRRSHNMVPLPLFSSKPAGLVWQVVRWCFKAQRQARTCLCTHVDMYKHHSADSRTSADEFTDLWAGVRHIRHTLTNVLMESYSLTSPVNRKELNIVIVPLIYTCYHLWPSWPHLTVPFQLKVKKCHQI